MSTRHGDAFEIFQAKAKEREEFWKGKIVECEIFREPLYTIEPPFAARVKEVRFNNRRGRTEYTLVGFGDAKEHVIGAREIFSMTEINDISSYSPSSPSKYHQHVSVLADKGVQSYNEMMEAMREARESGAFITAPFISNPMD